MLRQLILVVAGLTGAAGMALAAAAFHGGDAALGSASTICLANGPALIGLYIVARNNRASGLAALVLIIGTLIFVGDLLLRHFTGERLFPNAAPTGGTVMIVGWLLVAVAAFFGSRDAQKA